MLLTARSVCGVLQNGVFTLRSEVVPKHSCPYGGGTLPPCVLDSISEKKNLKRLKPVVKSLTSRGVKVRR